VLISRSGIAGQAFAALTPVGILSGAYSTPRVLEALPNKVDLTQGGVQAMCVTVHKKENIRSYYDDYLKRVARHTESVMEIVGIGEMTLYNQDAESDPPPSWVLFRNRVKAADAVLFATPEYNRSVPGVLKNARFRS
jgi:hypothetical protein